MQQHGLLKHQCVCLGAMSDTHVGAKLRVSETDLERLRCRERGQG